MLVTEVLRVIWAEDTLSALVGINPISAKARDCRGVSHPDAQWPTLCAYIYPSFEGTEHSCDGCRQGKLSKNRVLANDSGQKQLVNIDELLTKLHQQRDEKDR